MDKERILTHFKKEYWSERKDIAGKRLYPNVVEYELPDAVILAAPILGNYDINKLRGSVNRLSPQPNLHKY